MEKWLRRTIELGAGLILTGKTNPSVIPYYPQKTEIAAEETQYFRRTYPERRGVTSGRMMAMLRALEKEKRANIHNLLVVKEREVICECSHPGYDVNTWHLSHSMSKTVTGMAIGMLVDAGLLTVDTTLVSIFPEIHYRDKRFPRITVKHLLIMSSGIKFSEAGSVSESRWTEAFFDSAMSFEPGSSFHYNSMNSYILARIVCRISGMTLTEFLRPRLLEPLGIENFFWEMGPEGVEKGGWGIFASVESWAKLGQMMLDGGVFEGKRILSREWVKESTTIQIETPLVIGNYNYGYQLWVSREGDEFLFNGMLGQNVWVCPRNNVVVAVNSGNNELFQNSPAMAIVERYLCTDLTNDLSESCFSGDYTDLLEVEEHFFERRHWIRPFVPPKRRSLGYRLGFKKQNAFPEEWCDLLGRYNFTKNNYGMLPLFIRAMQNNLKNSIDGIAFEREGDRMLFVFWEGGDVFRLEIGFTDFKSTVLDYHGEKYIVRVMGEAMEDEDRNMLYKLELLFPEMPNVRMLKFSFGEDGSLIMRMNEQPNHRIADLFFDDMGISNPALAFFHELLEKRLGKRFIQRKLEDTFAPTLIGARVGAENYTEIMDREREKRSANAKMVKLIDTLIVKLIHDEDEMPKEEKGGLRGFIGDIVERIKTKFLPDTTPKPQREELPSAFDEELPLLSEADSSKTDDGSK
ncbi:MAG: serine hydrolase [Clostridia bacterium]|nr:serine hydrolase [Clostridia bacterium]